MIAATRLKTDRADGEVLTASVLPSSDRVVDVYEEEPLRDPSHPLFNMPNMVATPHISCVTCYVYKRHFSDIFAQIVRYAAPMSSTLVSLTTGVSRGGLPRRRRGA